MSHKVRLPQLGQPLPEISAVTTQGKINLPEDSKGKWLVLFSHPADFTPVCTTEFVAFQKRMDDFRALNVMLVGLSIDQVFAHIKWMQWIEEKLGVAIEFPVIADDQGKVAKRLGMLHSDKGTNTVRAVFVVDPEGILRLMLYYPQEIGRNMEEILRIIKALQTSDANNCTIPANWPHNELINGRVIVPPASDMETAKKRLEEHEGYDWWFCHRELNK